VEDFSDMLNLPKLLRTKLSDQCQIKTLDYVDSEISSETGTKKFVFEVQGKHKIESVIIPEGPGREQLFAYQRKFGCPLDCKFCANRVNGL